MTEKPIIFSGPMVRAILDGGKTQTRRVIKPQPPAGQYVAGCSWNKSKFAFWKGSPGKSCGCTCRPVHMAPGYRGERLWVREAFTLIDDMHGDNTVYYMADSDELGPWKSPIHMPRKYCRLFLDVKAVRVERLQDISEADAKAEGCNGFDEDGIKFNAQTGFRALWNTINDKRGYGWSVNPWVWVVEFEKVAA